jgi:Carboxypeptidase regulatory-like domain
LALFLSILIDPYLLRAQTTTTVVVGTVLDLSAAPVPGVQVTATNSNTNFSRTATTNDQGEYRIDFVPVGEYDVAVTAGGSERIVRQNLTLELGSPSQLDITLDAGVVKSTITVTGNAPLVNATTNELGRTIENQEIANLPLINRNAYQLLELTPGVQNSSFNPGQPNPVITLGYPEQRTFIDGGVDGGTGSVSYYLDGGINMTGLRNTGNILPNPDALEEYRVETNNYDAEYGKMSGGVVSVITKSGSNNYHGSLFDYWRDDVLNANNWGSILPKPPLRRDQFGGTFGGPIKKDKVFFFTSYQGLRQLSSFFFTGGTVPTPAERTGNLTGLVTALPSQYTCGSATVICPSLLDPVAQKLLNPTNATVDFPTIPDANVGTTGWQGISSSPFNMDEFLLKADARLSQAQSLSASYFFTSGNNSVPPLGSATGQPTGNIPWDVQQFDWRQQNLNLSETWTPSSIFVNQAWFSYTRNFGGRVNLPGISLGDLGSEFTIEGPHSLPQISVGGPIAFTAASAIAGPEAGTNFYAFRDVARYTHSRHTISFGAEETLEKDIQQTLLNNYGVFAFNNTNVTDAITGAKIAVPGIALFLMGLPTSISQDAPVTGYTNSWNTGFFAEDSIRVLPHLTVNLGLRWDITTPPTDPQNRETSFQLGEQSMAIPQAPEGALFYGDPGIARGVVPVRWHHISPRVGLAWDPFGDGKTSIRAAAGVFYNSVSGNEWNTVTNFEPSAVRFTFTNTTQSVTGSGMTAVPKGATLSCPYNGLDLKMVFGVTNTVTCSSTNGSGAELTGTDPFPFNPPNFFSVGGPFFGIAKNFQWPYSYQLNFSIQRQLASNFSVSVAYVGNLSHDLPFAQDINAPATGALASACATTGSGNVVERRPIDNPGAASCAAPGSPFSTVLLLRSNQTASYNGLQTTAELRMTHNVTFYAFYTYSHTFDSVQLDNNTTQGGAEDMTNLRLERGSADFDLRHQFVSAVLWHLDYFQGESRAAKAILNAWTLSSIINIHSGFPFTIYNGSDSNLTGNATAGTSAPTAGERAELVPSQDPVLKNPTATEWFNTLAFKQIPATSGISIDGNSRRNMLFGPMFKDVDLAISRDFPLDRLREGLDLQFRADAYNVFNMVSLNSPSGNAITAGSSTFGEILTANAMRQLQLGLRLSF